jgi:hypothetical protein
MITHHDVCYTFFQYQNDNVRHWAPFKLLHTPAHRSPIQLFTLTLNIGVQDQYMLQIQFVGRYLLLLGFGLIVPSGNLRKISAMWSIGAANIPIGPSKYGFSPALGWLLDGTKAFVRAKFLAKDSEFPRFFSEARACSRAGRSSFSSSAIWRSRRDQISFNLGM